MLCESVLQRRTCYHRCMSCAKLDPRRRGHYCQACFDRRHPPHRAKHAWMPIEKSEHLGRQLQHRNKVAEIEVFGDDVERLRRRVKEQQEDAAKSAIRNGRSI